MSEKEPAGFAFEGMQEDNDKTPRESLSLEIDEDREEEQESPEIKAKIEELKEIAKQKAEEILGQFNSVKSRVEGWGADDGPDYKKTTKEKVDFIEKRLSVFSKESGTVYLLNSRIESSAHRIIKSLNDIIDRIEKYEALSDDEKTVQKKGRIARIAGSSLDISHVLTSHDWRISHGLINNWRLAAQREMDRKKRKNESP